MGVYIKGMEMPNHCGECGIEWCERWKRLIVAGMPSAKARPEDCPLVPVPKHGRLIDAGNLGARAFRYLLMNGEESPKVVFAQAIKDAPTIIEAEEGEA